MLDKLTKHQIVGLDIDQTLIDGPKSHILLDWVKRNYKTKDLHLITFREGYDLKKVYADLIKAGYDPVMFKSLHGIPIKFYKAHALARQLSRYIKSGHMKKIERILKNVGITMTELQKDYLDTLDWKGHKCSELGATVLVDDLEDMVIKGCTKYNIEFVHSHYLVEPIDDQPSQ